MAERDDKMKRRIQGQRGKMRRSRKGVWKREDEDEKGKEGKNIMMEEG